MAVAIGAVALLGAACFWRRRRRPYGTGPRKSGRRPRRETLPARRRRGAPDSATPTDAEESVRGGIGSAGIPAARRAKIIGYPPSVGAGRRIGGVRSQEPLRADDTAVPPGRTSEPSERVIDAGGRRVSSRSSFSGLLLVGPAQVPRRRRGRRPPRSPTVRSAALFDALRQPLRAYRPKALPHSSSGSQSPSTGGTPPYRYRWNFGDGNSSSAADPTHAYATAGEYLASVTVTDPSPRRSPSTGRRRHPPPLAVSVAVWEARSHGRRHHASGERDRAASRRSSLPGNSATARMQSALRRPSSIPTGRLAPTR